MMNELRQLGTTMEVCARIAIEDGCDHPDKLFCYFPNFNTKAVQRLKKVFVQMYTSFTGKEIKDIPETEKRILVDTLIQDPEILHQVQKSGVSLGTITRALTRYFNPLEKVTTLLEQIGFLREKGESQVHKPTGLFVWALRHQKDLIMPETYFLKKEEEAAKEIKEKRVLEDGKPTPGGHCIYYQQKHEILWVDGLYMIIRPIGGDDGDDLKIHIDQYRPWKGGEKEQIPLAGD